MDDELLNRAHALRAESNDATLIDDALAALLARHRSDEIDATDAVAYAAHPLDEADEWGDLASFRAGAAATRRLGEAKSGGTNLPLIGRRPVVVLSREATIARLGMHQICQALAIAVDCGW